MSIIYLAGPMENVSDAEQMGWRDQMTLGLPEWSVLNPVHRSKKDGYNHRRIYELDMRDVRNSDVVFADLRRGQREAHGTAMEVQEAYSRNIPVIGWGVQDQKKHPFLEVCVTEWVTDLEKGIHILNEFYK